jgi:hypothetical protein
MESVARPVNTPECFHGEILSNSAVADDANNPGVDFLLVLPKQGLEGLKVARRKPFQQFHPPLSIPNYWFLAPMVTTFLGLSLFHSWEEIQAGGRHNGIQKKKARTVNASGPVGFC